MGSGTSGLYSDTPGGDLRLPASGLKFSSNQLKALNSYVDNLYEEDQKERLPGRISSELESNVESLVQRIVDGAGQRDPRFRCCHLIALHRGKKMRSRSLEYLVTLDTLPVLNSSEGCHLQDGPVGYGKIRLSGREADKWEEFLTPTGYLCRDKIIERWVELIARCANVRGGGGSRVLCARGAMKAQPYQYCYLERASPSQSSCGERLCIVEGSAWVMVRVGAGEAEAKLMLTAKVDGQSDKAYTTGVPLTHPLAMLHYHAAKGGYYAVAVGPPTSIVCAERASTWQLWHPSLEATLDAHCSDLAPVGRGAAALNVLVDRMREGCYQGSLRLLSRYAVSCALRRRLDRCAQYPTAAARCFVSTHFSHHLLLVLDSLVSLCSGGGPAGYVYPVERGCVVRRGIRGSDWLADAACITSCLLHLNQVEGEDIPPSPSESLETALFCRWENINKEQRSSTPNYSRRQLKYIRRVTSELISLKNSSVIENHSNFRLNLIQATSLNEECIEELIHVLAIMLDQARDLYMNNFYSKGEFDRELSAYRSKKWNKLKVYYDASSACLIDAVRRDPDLRKEDLSDLNLIRQVLNWLYKGIKDDKKYLGPVLKPYLEGLFTVSLESSMLLDEFDAKKCEMEFDGLKSYCIGVHDGHVEPCVGLLEAAKKLTWAKAMVDFVDKFKHIDFRLVFPTGEGMAISFSLKLPSRREHSSRVLTLNRRDKADAKLRLAERSVLGAFNRALIGDRGQYKPLPVPSLSVADPGLQELQRKGSSNHKDRKESSEEILANVKSGQYWRTSKPDIIPSGSVQDISTQSLDLQKLKRRSRRNRPITTYGYPEISITDQSDKRTLRRKYHTLKCLVYTEPVENIKEFRRRPRSAGSSVRNKEALSRPSILETLDFINSVKDTVNVEESGTSDAEDTAWGTEEEWVVGQASPVNLLMMKHGSSLHWLLADLVPAMLHQGRFTALQELCTWLGDSSEGALFALHRLSRAARSRSSERSSSSWKLPEADGVPMESHQRYKSRPPDYMSGDEAPQPPPLPRRSSREKMVPKIRELPSKSLQDLEQHLNYLELVSSRLNLKTQKPPNENYTGIINPIYDIKIPKDKFVVKRSKSLGRSFGPKHLALEMSKYNLTLGRKSVGKTNDVVTAISGISGETGLDPKSNFSQRYSGNVVGDSYRLSRYID